MKTLKGEGVSKDPMKPMSKTRRPRREWEECVSLSMRLSENVGRGVKCDTWEGKTDAMPLIVALFSLLLSILYREHPLVKGHRQKRSSFPLFS